MLLSMPKQHTKKKVAATIALTVLGVHTTRYTSSNRIPEVERTNRGTKVLEFVLKGSNVLEAHATSGDTAVNTLEAPYTGDAPFPPIDAGDLTLDDIKYDYKVIVVNPEIVEPEEKVIVYPNGKPSEDVKVPPTTEGPSSSTDETIPESSTKDKNASGDKNAPGYPKDNVNNVPDNNPTGSTTEKKSSTTEKKGSTTEKKGSTTEKNVTKPDIPPTREEDKVDNTITEEEVSASDSYENEIKHKVTNDHSGQSKVLGSFLTIGSIALLVIAFMLGRSNRKDG